MKSIRILAIALVMFLVGAGSANAQKVGYVNLDVLVTSLPEMKGVQEKLEKYRVDTLEKQGAQLLKDYREKDSVLQKTTLPSVKQVLEKDLAELANTLNNWQQVGSQLMQSRENLLVRPLYTKVLDAVNAVAKEKAYSHVLNPGVFIVAPVGDDITTAVATKLGVKLDANFKPGINFN